MGDILIPGAVLGNFAVAALLIGGFLAVLPLFSAPASRCGPPPATR